MTSKHKNTDIDQDAIDPWRAVSNVEEQTVVNASELPAESSQRAESCLAVAPTGYIEPSTASTDSTIETRQRTNLDVKTQFHLDEDVRRLFSAGLSREDFARRHPRVRPSIAHFKSNKRKASPSPMTSSPPRMTTLSAEFVSPDDDGEDDIVITTTHRKKARAARTCARGPHPSPELQGAYSAVGVQTSYFVETEVQTQGRLTGSFLEDSEDEDQSQQENRQRFDKPEPAASCNSLSPDLSNWIAPTRRLTYGKTDTKAQQDRWNGWRLPTASERRLL